MFVHPAIVRCKIYAGDPEGYHTRIRAPDRPDWPTTASLPNDPRATAASGPTCPGHWWLLRIMKLTIDLGVASRFFNVLLAQIVYHLLAGIVSQAGTLTSRSPHHVLWYAFEQPSVLHPSFRNVGEGLICCNRSTAASCALRYVAVGQCQMRGQQCGSSCISI